VFGFGAFIWLKIAPTQELVRENQPELTKALFPARERIPIG
jgi:hypothetical protein